MHSVNKSAMNKLQKKIMVTLLILTLLTPAGIFLPMFFNAGDAWGEWSAATVKEFIGYVPEGLARYSNTWKAPINDYTINSRDASAVHQSGYYIISGLIGATMAMAVTILFSKLIIRHGK